MSDDLLRAIEHAAVRGWPALERREIDGWIWRYASGGSIRANSVAALTWLGTDIATTVAACEALYHARGVAAVFTISDVSVPADLDARLAERGYLRGDDHVTMAKPVASAEQHADITVGETPTRAWLDTYLTGLAIDRRGVAERLIANVPKSARYIAVCDRVGSNGGVAATGLSIVDGALASVQCMATRPDQRRRGHARHVLDAIDALARVVGATHLYLQTGADNAAARALYASKGYRVVGRYHTRTKPRD